MAKARINLYKDRIKWAKDKRNINKRGYVFVYDAQRGFICEHILVMEEKLGRPLRKGETVHHINNIKTDNRPENLEVYQSNSEHMTLGKHINGRNGSKMKKIHLDDHITINVDPALKDTVEIFAQRKYLNKSDIIRIAIWEYLEKEYPTEFPMIYAQQQELLKKGI